MNVEPKLSVAVIGCGNMGGAIVRAILARGEGISVVAIDTGTERLRALEAYAESCSAADRLATSTPWRGAPEQALDAVVVAVKPHLVPELLRQLPDLASALVISVAAGLEATVLRSCTPLPVVRAMPNTPGLVGAGVTSILVDGSVDDAHARTTERIFATMGTTVRIERETLMHAATALGGSGPALVAMIVEALADGAVLEGLPRSTAYAMARAMVAGTTELLAQESPSELKDRVSSPGGTTIRGVAAAEAHGLRHALIAAIRAIAERSRTLADEP